MANVRYKNYLNSNMNPRLTGHFSIFGLVFFELRPLLGIASQWISEKLQF